MEAILVYTGTRHWQNKLPLYLLPLQGIAEGGFVILSCLLTVDCFLQKPYLTTLFFSLIMLVLFLWAHLQVYWDDFNPNTTVRSRRQMDTTLSILWLSGTIIFTLWFFLYGKEFIRGILLLTTLSIFGVVWNFSEWSAGTRWVECGNQIANKKTTIYLLLWNAIVETAFIYMPFYILKSLLG